MIQFNLEDDPSLESDSELGKIVACPKSCADSMASFSKVVSAGHGARPEQPESPVDPMLLVSEQFKDIPEEEPNELLSLMHAPIIEPSCQLEDAPLVHAFTDTSMTSFPFPEMALASFALQSYCLFHWYKLWDVPAPALKPHMSEPWNPCSNPITLDEINAPLLRKFPYVVSTKTNGIRVQLLVTRHPVTQTTLAVLVDRNMGMFDIGCACLGVSETVMAKGTLLDGELVERTDGKWAFILFDVVAVRGASIRKTVSLKERLLSFWDEYERLDEGILSNGHTIVWMTKSMYSLKDNRAIEKVMGEARPYATDGLVFTPLYFAIPFETSPFLFKWKPNELQSIDFRLVGHAPHESRDKWGLELLYKYQTKERNLLQGYWFIGYMFSMGSISIRSSEALQKILSRWSSRKDLTVQSCIVECKLTSMCLDTETMEWEVMRERTDKSEPNSEITLLGTLKTILYPLTMDSLKEVTHQAMF